MDRYHRQMLLPFIGQIGQQKLLSSRVLLVGCGALGGVIAEQLVRAGVGHLTLVDRDVVEWTNLQRQVLFDESDARGGIPKAIAAARRLSSINSSVHLDSQVMDVHAGNILSVAQVNLILDGTDNAQTRYLLNDVAVQQNIPWVYGACVGTDGRVMTILPGVGACLQCVFPEPPGVGELQTCDTVGVLGPAIAVVAGLQAAAAIKMLSGNIRAADTNLLTIDLWNNRYRTIETGGPRPKCVCCGERRFTFLDQPVEATAATLCGRNAVQIRPAHAGKIDLQQLALRLGGVGTIEASPFLLRSHLAEAPGTTLTIFPDGRCIVQGTTDPARARSLVSQYVGS